MAVAALSSCAEARFPRIVVRMGEGGPIIGATTGGALIASDGAEAAAIARRIMAEGGTAADAAVAAAFTLAAELPSRAGLNARGTCLIQHDGRDSVDGLDFTAAEDAGDMPSFVRAMVALHSFDGAAPWPKLIAPAERLARFGVAVSPALASDLREGTSLLSDGAALLTFTSARRQLLAAGEPLKQPTLADRLDRLRTLRPGTLQDEGGRYRPAAARSTGDEKVVEIGSAGSASPTASFVVSDGKATVACTLSMGQRFGRGMFKDGVLLPTDTAGIPGPTIVIGRGGSLRRAVAPGFSGDNSISCRATEVGIECEASVQ